MTKVVKFLLLTIIFFPFSGYAQGGEVEISGKILDEKTQEPVIGATVSIVSSKGGTISDTDGNFYLRVRSLPVTVSIDYLGYRKQEVDIYESTEPVIIQLTESANFLNEIVVVGYGTQRRSDISGLVASVPKVNLEQPQTSFDNLLSGAVAGVQVTQSSGQPGASASIRIRGGNSITGGNEPLYVIDGQIMYNNNAATSAGIAYAGAGLNALATINPADIESIEVLKDASATAIYGSRGANGVILVTTKKGTGKDRVSYTGSVGQSVVGRKLDLLNAREWALLRNDIIDNDNITSERKFTQEEIDALQNYDYQDAVLRTALTQNHQLSLSGGDDKTKYLVSGNYYKQDGVVINTDFERYSLRANFTRTFSNRFKTGLSLSTSSSTQTGVSVAGRITGSPNALGNVLMTPPVVPIYEADGSYHLDDTYNIDLNTIADLKETTSETKVNRTFGNFFAEYKPIPSLTAKLNAGADVINTRQNYYAPAITSAGYATNGRGYVGNNLTKSWQTELTLTYDENFGDNHHLTALAGYTTEASYIESVLAVATNFLSEITGHNDLGGGDAGQPDSDAYPWALNSLLARVNYTFLKRYNVTASFRTDGSSRFPAGNKWAYFPSVGLSWNVHEEDFLKNVKPVGNLKVRLSAGSIGNQEIGDFQYAGRWSPVLYGLGGQLVTGYAPENIANPNLKWETTTQYNAGFDLRLLKDRISLVFDTYYKLTNDLLVEVPVPTSSGYERALANVGSVSNKGIEFTLNANVINGKRAKSFSWHTAFTIAHNRNRVESLGDDVDSYTPRVPDSNIGRFSPLIVQEGYALGTFWGYKTDGIVQTSDNLASIPKPSWTRTETVLPGDRKYIDSGGDPVVFGRKKRI